MGETVMGMGFASQSDLADKTEILTELADGVFARTAEGDPNCGVEAGDTLKRVHYRAMQTMRPRYDTPRIWTAERDMEMWRALAS